MRFEFFPGLGTLVLQDHRRSVDLHRRAALMACRVIKRDFSTRGNLVAEGHVGDESGSRRSVGDLGLGSVLWRPTSETSRPIPAWFFAAPAVTTEASRDLTPDPAPEVGGSRTRLESESTEAPRGEAEAAQRVKVRPIFDVDFRADDRFEEIDAAMSRSLPRLPKGWPGVVLSVTQEHAQKEVFLPAAGGQLVAVNAAGDPSLASIVYDLTDEDEIDRERGARLHSMMRVARVLAGKCGLVTANAIAWQVGHAGRDGYQGLGLFSESNEQQVAALDGTAPPAEEDQDLTKTRTRDLGATAERSDDEGDPARARASAQVVYGMASHHAGGPFHAGDPADAHRCGSTRDGNPVNAGHLPLGVLFKLGPFDAPLDFQLRAYSRPRAMPHKSRVHLVWDGEAVHTWPGGSAPGMWRFEGESAIVMVPPPFVDPQPPPQPPPLPPPQYGTSRPETGSPRGTIVAGGGGGGSGEADTVGTVPDNTSWLTPEDGQGANPDVPDDILDEIEDTDAAEAASSPEDILDEIEGDSRPDQDAADGGHEDEGVPTVGGGSENERRRRMCAMITSCLKLAGGVSFKAHATERGQADAKHAANGVPPWLMDAVLRAPDVVNLIPVGAGDGTWDGFDYTTAPGNGLHGVASGGLAIVPGDVHESDLYEGSPTTSTGGVNVWLPPGLSSVALASPDYTTGGSRSGVKIEGIDVEEEIDFIPFKHHGAEVSILDDGGTVQGKLTVERFRHNVTMTLAGEGSNTSEIVADKVTCDVLDPYVILMDVQASRPFELVESGSVAGAGKPGFWSKVDGGGSGKHTGYYFDGTVDIEIGAGSGGGGAGADCLGTTRTDMTGDLVLDGDSTTVQMLAPDQAGRSVALPDAADKAMLVLANLSGIYPVTIRDGDSQVAPLETGGVRLLLSDGVDGWVASSDLRIVGSSLGYGTTLYWGDDAASAGKFLQHGMSAQENTGSTYNSSILSAWWGEAVLTEAGTIEAIEGQTNALSLTLEIYKNGALADTIVCTVTAGRVTSNGVATSFARGDTVAVKVTAISASGKGVGLQMLYVPSTRAAAHVRLGPFGMINATKGRLWSTYLPKSRIADNGPHESEFPVPFATTVRRISWASNGGNDTTQVEILKNGVSLAVVTWTGAKGVKDLDVPLPVAAGDTVQLKRPFIGGGTSPDDSMIAIDVDGIGQVYGWGAQSSTGVNLFHTARTTTREAAIVGSSTYQTRQYIPAPGTARGFAWSKSNTTGGTLQVYKNGALDETVSIAAAKTGYVELMNRTLYVRGDYIDVVDNNSADIGAVRTSVYVA